MRDCTIGRLEASKKTLTSGVKKRAVYLKIGLLVVLMNSN